MWYKSESMTSPTLTDTVSSKKWVYIRRHVKTEIREDSFGNEYTVYVYEEQKILKENYPIYLGETNNSNRLDDIEDVLAEIMGT